MPLKNGLASGAKHGTYEKNEEMGEDLCFLLVSRVPVRRC